MPDACDAERVLQEILRQAWPNERYREELLKSPELLVQREVLRLGGSLEIARKCLELLATIAPCPDEFAFQPDDLFVFQEHLLGG